jgi:prepilin-type processing-associated H-X9-DG protein
VDVTDPTVSSPFPGPAQLVGAALYFAGIVFNLDPSDDEALKEDIDLDNFGFGGYGNGGGNVIRRLRDGIERFLITDINDVSRGAQAESELPIMWDKLSTNVIGDIGFNHVPGGCNTLYMDGHVQFVKLGDKFPATAAHAALNALFE